MRRWRRRKQLPNYLKDRRRDRKSGSTRSHSLKDSV